MTTFRPAVTRFAPSPTGYIHIGNVRSAIYPWLLARQTGGRFILRIEDTDRERLVPGATAKILETLAWLGLDWDYGPERGENADFAEPTTATSKSGLGTKVPTAGPKNATLGPFFQSERLALYHEWARKLLAAGRAYPDPTPGDQTQAYREADQKAGRPYLYRHHRPEQADQPAGVATWAPGTRTRPTVPLRFLADPKPRSWRDAVMGELRAGPEVQDDFILIKADGYPTYNFAHIVDDALMGVTHVIRGIEYLASTPNYLALYEALGVAPPVLVSLPHILAPEGNKKLSKRDGAKSVEDYRAEGILPEAMLNFLACLGWNDGTEREIYTVEELITGFSLEKIQKSGARFDEKKLLWLNGQWLRRIATENNKNLGAQPDAETLEKLRRNQISGAELATERGIAQLYARTLSKNFVRFAKNSQIFPVQPVENFSTGDGAEKPESSAENPKKAENLPEETEKTAKNRKEAENPAKSPAKTANLMEKPAKSPGNTQKTTGKPQKAGNPGKISTENSENAENLAENPERCGFWPEAARDFPEDYRKQVLALVYDRLKTLGELAEVTGYFFAEPETQLEMLTESKFLRQFKPQELAEILQKVVERLVEIPEAEWQSAEIQQIFDSLLAETGLKPAELFSLIRISVSFAPFSPALNLTLAVLGRERTLGRLNRVRAALAES